MALWKEKDLDPAKKEPSQAAPEASPARPREPSGSAVTPSAAATPRPKAREAMESVIGSDLVIEGTIQGSGHVRLVGKFKGDVQVEGDLTIEKGAKVTGSVRAATVVIGGELEGNVEAAQRVELLDTGVVHGDIKAGSLTVAAGSRMRGQAEFGWDEKELRAPTMKVESTAVR